MQKFENVVGVAAVYINVSKYQQVRMLLKDNLEDRVVDGKIILNLILAKQNRMLRFGLL
jgi:hypothetical protein